jgi:hypothetical protein
MARHEDLVLRSGVFAASRRMGVRGLMVRDGASAPPHHEGACAWLEIANSHSPNARNPAKLQGQRNSASSLDFPGFAAMVRATFGKSERSNA